MEDIGTVNVLRERVDEAIKKSGFDPHFIEAIKMHLGVLQKYFIDKDTIESQKVLCDVFLSKIFIDNLSNMYPDKRFTCQVDESFDWNFEIFPSEIFAEEKLPVDFRKQLFFQCLKVADVLDCKVTYILSTKYVLQVVNKYGSARLLSDLCIMVTLPRIQTEVSLLKTELNFSELIRVAVFAIETNDQKIEVKVTLDENTLQFTKKYIQLGRINENDLPLYLHDQAISSNCKSLTDYLNSCPEFENPLAFDTILNGFGLDEKRIYSFYPNIDSWNCPDEMTGKELLQAAKKRDLENFLNLAASEQKCGNIPKTLDAIEVALEYDSKCPKAYEIRGIMYAELNKPAISQKALLDFEMVYQLDTNNVTAKKYMSDALLKAAVKFCKAKNFKKGLIACQKALDLHGNNEKASVLMDKLVASSKKGIAESLKNVIKIEKEITPKTVLKPIENPFSNETPKDKCLENLDFEEESLVDLQKKKQELQFKLKVIN